MNCADCSGFGCHFDVCLVGGRLQNLLCSMPLAMMYWSSSCIDCSGSGLCNAHTDALMCGLRVGELLLERMI